MMFFLSASLQKVSMLQSSSCLTKYSSQVTKGFNKEYVRRISLKYPLSCSDKDKSQTKDDKSSFDEWKKQAQTMMSKASFEWKRTKFFEEGGTHGFDHNIRPQPHYYVPKSGVAFIVIIWLILIRAFTLPPEDLSETNAYFKSLKEKETIDKQTHNR